MRADRLKITPGSAAARRWPWGVSDRAIALALIWGKKSLGRHRRCLLATVAQERDRVVVDLGVALCLDVEEHHWYRRCRKHAIRCALRIDASRDVGGDPAVALERAVFPKLRLGV